MRLLTIGVYGFAEARFFEALREAGVDTFCDVRDRRGVRGREYAYANRHRLETKLARIGIRYLHFRDLAPSSALRALQLAADRETRTARRQRLTLSSGFRRGYDRECLRRLHGQRFLDRLPSDARAIVLFCVEGNPAACHRSLLAARLQAEFDCEVTHLMPG